MLTIQKPDFEKINPSNINYESEKRLALDYARIELSLKDLKEETIKYIKNKDIQTKNYNLSKIDDYNFSIIGKYAWILNQNGTLAPDTLDFFNKRLKHVLSNNKSSEFKKSNLKTSDKNKLEGSELFQSLEDLILEDKLNDDNIYNLLVERRPTPSATQQAIKNINTVINEIINSDEEHKKSYGDYNKLIGDLNSIKNELSTFKENTKTRQKVEKEKLNAKGKKAKILKVTSDLNYKKEDPELKLVSINPMSVVNTNTLMTYNTKTRKIGMYYSENNQGLVIRGTTVYNFDTGKSFQKTLRKPEEQLKFLRNISLKRAEIVLNDYIKGKKQTINGRINEHIILMETW